MKYILKCDKLKLNVSLIINRPVFIPRLTVFWSLGHIVVWFGSMIMINYKKYNCEQLAVLLQFEL